MESSSENNNGLSLGEQLRQRREARGLSLGEVAERLKLSVRQLEAIERNDFALLPGSTFVRGFVRNYARYLEMDVDALMALLDAKYPPASSDVPNLADASHAEEGEAAVEETRSRWPMFLVLALLGGGAAWWFGIANTPRHGGLAEEPMPGPGLSESSAPQAQPASVPLAQAPAPVAPAQPASASTVTAPAAVASAPAAAPAVKPGKAQAASAPAATPASTPTPVRAAEASAPAAPSRRSVSLSLSVKADEAWVSVTDADGKKLVFATLTPGTPTVVQGRPPFKVVLGNAGQVELAYDGQAYNFNDKIKGSTAKFSLGQ